MGFRAFDRVSMTAASAPGTGAFVLGSALTGYQSLQTAGVYNGDTFTYIINDGNAWELGVGTYNGENTEVLRTTIVQTSNNNQTALALSANAILTATVRASDLNLPPTQASTGLTSNMHFGAGGASVQDVPGGITLEQSTALTATRCGISFIYKSAPVSPYTLTAKISALYSSSGYAGACVGWYNGTNKLHVLALVAQAGAAPRVEFQKWSDPATWVANDQVVANNAFNQLLAYPIWMQLAISGDTLVPSISLDGSYFTALGSYAIDEAYLGTGGYSNVLFGMNLCENASLGASLQAWSGA